jgi:hypothetical protein
MEPSGEMARESDARRERGPGSGEETAERRTKQVAAAGGGGERKMWANVGSGAHSGEVRRGKKGKRGRVRRIRGEKMEGGERAERSDGQNRLRVVTCDTLRRAWSPPLDTSFFSLFHSF